MKVLHTSDWHLGHTWSGRQRKNEFNKFLDWMIETVEHRDIDVLIVAGDIFDTSVPSTETQEMYMKFLRRVASDRRHVVIVSGNHDSPSLLDVPKPFLREFKIHVVGVAGKPEDELIEIRPPGVETGPPSLIVAAVPFLRDRDIRKAVEGESLKEAENRTIAGIRNHYKNVCDAAGKIRQKYPDQNIPLVVTGHLFAAGIDSPGDVRDIHVGALGRLGSDIFPPDIDYLALGHIHRPSRVAGRDTYRYSGSPIPMSFDEANQEKIVVQIDFDGRTPKIETIPVPRFSNILRIEGDLSFILKTLDELQKTDIGKDRDSFVEVTYSGRDPIHDLVRQVEDAVTLESVEIVRILNRGEGVRVGFTAEAEERLEDFKPTDVFDRLLKEHESRGDTLSETFRSELVRTFRELLEEYEQTT